MSAQQTEKTAAGQKKKTVILVLIILVLLGIILVLLFGGKEEPKRNVVITEGNAQEVIFELSEMEVVPPGQFEVNMNSTWYFASGTAASSNAYVGNVANNSHDVYFDVELPNGEVILQSPVIPRGSHMENITLDKDLDAGTYDCSLIYYLVDENQVPQSTLQITLTIIVEG